MALGQNATWLRYHPIVDVDPLIGQRLGRYEIERALGEGGMGKVYAAINPEIGSRVAIKVLHSGRSGDPSIVERFFTEARAVNIIRHENIVNILDLSTLPDGRPFIVMEHLMGAPLTKLIIPGGKLPLSGLSRVMLDVLAALDAAHAAGIVHRDLKPDNIFVTPEGNGKVLDFGIAKLRPDHGTTATREGLVFGTPLYMSPEQVTDGALDARSDLYSLGVVLYEASTGEPPFNAANTYEILTAHIEKTAAPPRSKRSDLPEAFEAVIVRAMSKDREARFASAVEMAAALAASVKDLPNEPLVPPSSRRLSAAIDSAPPSAPLRGLAQPAFAVAAAAPSGPQAAAVAPAAPGASTVRTFERHQVRARWPMLVTAAVVATIIVAIVLALR